MLTSWLQLPWRGVFALLDRRLESDPG